MECNRDAHLIPGKSRSYKAGWVKLCPRIGCQFLFTAQKIPRRIAPHGCRSPKPHPIRLTTADAPAHAKERQETVDSGSEAGQLGALGTHPATTKRGGAQVGAAEQPDGRTGRSVANRLGWLRPPVGHSDGGGHLNRDSGFPCLVSAAQLAVGRVLPYIAIGDARVTV